MPTLSDAFRSWLTGLLLVFALLALPAQHARAQEGGFVGGYDNNWRIPTEAYVVILGSFVGMISGSVFLVADLVRGGRIPPFAAALELALAGLPLLTSGLVAMASPDIEAGFGGPLLMLAGIGFTIHALDSLFLYESAPPPRAAGGAHARNLSVAPVLAPNLIGGAVTAHL